MLTNSSLTKKYYNKSIIYTVNFYDNGNDDVLMIKFIYGLLTAIANFIADDVY